jgi:iron complex outermembrane receptor protein
MKTFCQRPTKRRVKRANKLLRRALGVVVALARVSSDGGLYAASKEDVDLAEVSIDQLMEFKVQSVYGASKHEESVGKAPASVTIVTADEIKFLGHRNLGEALASVRSLYVTYDRNYSYLGVRGFDRPGDYTSRVLVLVNGHRINENVLDSALIGNDFFLDVDAIEKIEVIRGPSSSIYGNNAFFGVINVVTKSGRTLNGATGSVAYGSFDTYKGDFMIGKKFENDFEFFLNGAYMSSDGPARLYYPEYDTPAYNNGVTVGTDYESFYKSFAQFNYKAFTLEGGYSTREKGIPTGSYGTIFNDRAAKTIDQRAYANLGYNQDFEHDLNVQAHLSYDYYRYDGTYPIYNLTNDRILYTDYALGNWWGGDVQLRKTVWEKHTVTVGSEFRDNLNQDQGNLDTDTPPNKYDNFQSSWSVGFYSQAEVELHKGVTLDAGGRFDYFSTFGSTLNPRIGLILNPADNSTIKLLYGTAFKAPNAYELFYGGPNNKGNPNLNPEKISTYEAVLEQQFLKHYQFSLSGFYYQIEDLITQTTDPVDGLLVYRNLNQASALGIEGELDAKFQNGIGGSVSITAQNARDDDLKVRLSNSPQIIAKGNVITPLWPERLFLGLEVRYVSDTTNPSGAPISDYWLANATLVAKVWKGLDLSASVYNLFDSQIYNSAAGEHLQQRILQDGRTFRLKATYHF